jgi:outer membrane protein TolC
MKRTLLTISLLTITLIPSAEAKAEPLTLTLDKAIETALLHNQQKKISALDIRIAEEQYKQAMSANFPSVDLNMAYIKRDEDLINITKGEFALSQDLSNALALISAPDAQKPQVQQMIQNNMLPPVNVPLNFTSVVMGDETTHTSVKVTYPLYSGGKISALQKEAKLGKEIAAQKDKRTKEEIVFSIKKYFYASILTQNISELMHETSERMTLLDELTEEMYKNGSKKVKKTDYYKTQLASAMFKAMDEEYKTKARLAKSALLFAMGLSPEEEVALKEPSFNSVKLPALPTLLQNAYLHNKQLTTLHKALELYHTKIDEARSGYKPNIALFGTVEHTDNNYDGGMSNDQNDNAWTLGVGASWNLFNGFRTTAEIEKAKLELLRLKEKESQLKQAIVLQTKQGYLSALNNNIQSDILSKAVVTAEKNRDLNTRAYQADMVETKDVVEAQIHEAQIKAKYFKTLHDKMIAYATVDLVTGR